VPERSDIRLRRYRRVDRPHSLPYGGHDLRRVRRPKTQDAVIRNLKILGEAAKNLPDAFKEQYPDVPWRLISRMRARLIHRCFGASLEIAWESVRADIPALREHIRPIRAP